MLFVLRHQAAAMARNLLFFLSGDNLNFVCREPQGFKPFRGRRPNVVAVLSDAAGEDHNIYTTQQGYVGADHLAHRDSKDVQRQSGLRIAGAGTLLQGLYIALAGRETEKATLMIQQSFEFVGIELFIAQKINDHARVEVTRPRAHGMPPVGVRPMVVSIDTPFRSAQRLDPFPRCAKMARWGTFVPK